MPKRHIIVTNFADSNNNKTGALYRLTLWFNNLIMDNKNQSLVTVKLIEQYITLTDFADSRNQKR